LIPRFIPPLIPWLVFAIVVTVALALDLGVFRRRPREMTVRQALAWLVGWVGLAAAFNIAVGWWFGSARALEFTAAYLMEETLSVDNMFVFYVIFSYFRVTREHQHRVLFWGIIGALALRGIFVATGAALLARFDWIIYLFGAFLVFTGVRLFFHSSDTVEPEKNPVVKLFRRFVPLHASFVGHRFSIQEAGRWMATPLLLVLVLVEATDVAFATDSIPAVFAISRHPFIVYSSNVFAVLGLRSLYFVLAGVIGGFRYLNYGLGMVLAFVGVKMLLAAYYPISTGVSLAVVGSVIGASIAASLWRR
jgi:tellurite resistance protein TerC